MDSSTKVRKMDAEMAMAFAGDAFEKRYPRETWPSWLRKCVVPCYTVLDNGNYLVSFAVTLKATRDTKSIFQVEIDSSTAETKVHIGEALNEINEDDLVFSS
jgi:hypothetical protein